MYISESTAAERVHMSMALDGVFDNVDRARRILSNLLDEYFGMAEQKEICVDDAEILGDLLYVIGDMLFNAILEYSLSINNTHFFGVNTYKVGAQRFALAEKVDTLKIQIHDLGRQMPYEQRTALQKKLTDLCELSDEQAASALEALLQETEGKT